MQEPLFLERHQRSALENFVAALPLLMLFIGFGWLVRDGSIAFGILVLGFVFTALTLRQGARTQTIITVSPDALRITNTVRGSLARTMSITHGAHERIEISDIKIVERCGLLGSLLKRSTPRTSARRDWARIHKLWFTGVRIDYIDKKDLPVRAWVRLPVRDVAALKTALRQAGYTGEFLPGTL